MGEKKKKAQIGMEYLVIVGFLTFVIIATLGIALYHNNVFRDMISTRQIESMANKIISSAETVFYSGEPSKVTIASYVPEGISNINISDNLLIITYTISSGTNIIAFPSNVPITGNLSINPGIREITITATSENVVLSS